MLAANETIAEDFYWRQLPFVYRNHEEPDMEKVSQLTTFINNFGYSVKMSKEQIHPKELQKLLKNIEGTPEEALISRITLRSMKRAEYTPECKGHFGLAAKYYCHFTSPIRFLTLIIFCRRLQRTAQLLKEEQMMPREILKS